MRSHLAACHVVRLCCQEASSMPGNSGDASRAGRVRAAPWCVGTLAPAAPGCTGTARRAQDAELARRGISSWHII